jgi:cytochrome c peroxidase
VFARRFGEAGLHLTENRRGQVVFRLSLSSYARVLDATYLVPRTSPSLFNSGLGPFYMFWDGRLSGFGSGVQLEGGPLLPGGMTDLLAAQALLPVLDRREMRGEAGDTDVFGAPNELAVFADDERVEIWNALMARLLAIPEYVAMFEAAFPTVPAEQLRFEHAARALAAFQMEAFTKADSPFDRYLHGEDRALTAEEKRGALLFFGPAHCAECHSGPLLGGRSFANIGAPQIGPGGRTEPPLDLGRGEHQDARFYRFAFRVPPLRNVELTSPYMHSGAYATLDAVVRHYDDVPAALRDYDASQLPPRFRDLHHGDDRTVEAVLSTLDGRLQRRLDLTDEEVEALVAFLKSLTDPSARDLGSLTPAAVPSGLPVPR